MNIEPNRPILYSFRRCPYAMRARFCLAYCNIDVDLRNILLNNKPLEMLEASPKGTVPVLVLENSILDESLDIMKWALVKNDPDGWLQTENTSLVGALITENDDVFKSHLDKYKYSSNIEKIYHRDLALALLHSWEQRLHNDLFLVSAKISLADAALFPFVRQFAQIDKEWFEQQPLPKLHQWLSNFLEHDLFKRIMNKAPIWQGNSH